MFIETKLLITSLIVTFRRGHFSHCEIYLCACSIVLFSLEYNFTFEEIGHQLVHKILFGLIWPGKKGFIKEISQYTCWKILFDTKNF